MKRMTLTIMTAALLALPTFAAAAVVQADFNDLAAGGIATQSGGTGFSGAWGGSTFIDVVSGDLSAPVATNFALTQSGTAQSVVGDGTSTDGAVTRLLDTPLSGTVWFSFLVNQVDGDSRAGIEFNPSAGSNTTGQRIVAVGSALRLLVGGGDITVSGASFSFGTTALVLGRVLIDPVGNETLSIWFNPDVANLGAANTVVTDRNFLGSSGIVRLGIESYQNNATNTGGIIDLVTLADGAGAYSAVTGVPTPAALPAGLALMGLLGAPRFGRLRPNRATRRM